MSKQQIRGYSMHELMNALKEKDTPLLVVLDQVITIRKIQRAKQFKAMDSCVYLSHRFIPELAKELESIKELRTNHIGQIVWDGITIVPCFFTEESMQRIPQIQCLFFIDDETMVMEGM